MVERVVFSSSADDTNSLRIIRIDGTTANETLPVAATDVKIACDWSVDGGSFWTSRSIKPLGRQTCGCCRCREKERRSRSFTPSMTSGTDSSRPTVSGWRTSRTNPGRPEIYIQPFPGPGPKARVSINGGTQVRWRSNGKEMFYIAPDERLMVVDIDLAAGAAGVGTPAPLFTMRLAPIRSISRQQYVVAPDGQRFLISSVEESATSPITLILNWKGNRNVAPDGVPR